MNVFKLQKYKSHGSSLSAVASYANGSDYYRRFPQLDQGEIFSLQDAFNRLDVEDRGYVDESTTIKAVQQSERQPYDVVRAALKDVELDSSRRVELEDYVDVRPLPAPFLLP
jgi:plastin-1